MILFYTFRGNRGIVRSSFVELGDDFYLPDDVTVFDEADFAVKEHCKRLIEAAIAEMGADVVLNSIDEFDED